MVGYAPQGVPSTPAAGADLPGADQLASTLAQYTQPQPGYQYASALPFGMKYDAQGNPTDMSFSLVPWEKPFADIASMAAPPQPLSDSSDPMQLATGGRFSAPAEQSLLAATALPALTGKVDPNVLYTFGGKKALEGPIEGGPGWFTGVEGKQKFEISDYGSSTNLDALRAAREQNIQEMLKAEPRNKMGGYAEGARAKAENYVDNHIASTARLGDVLNHPRLFDQYPVLADRPVTLKNLGSSSGATTVSGRILLHNNLLDNPEEAHGVLLHEVQHIIQDKEGFAPGTSPTWTGPAMDDILRQRQAVMLDQSRPMPEREAAADDVTRLTSYMSSKNAAYNAYQNTAGEVEARNVEARFKRQQGMVGEAQGDLFKDTRRRLMNRWNYARQFEAGMPLGKYQGIERTADVPPERQFLWPGEAPFNWSAPPSYGLARAGLEPQARPLDPTQQAQADSGRRRLIMNALSQGQ